MSPRHRRTLIPGLALGLVLAGALAVTLTAGQAPDAKLRARVRAYLTALGDGDPMAAAAYRLDRNPWAERHRAEHRQGVPWLIRRQSIQPGGREARVIVTWARRGPGLQPLEVQLWRREKPGTWSFVALDG
jgi:hypothetical protein